MYVIKKKDHPALKAVSKEIPHNQNNHDLKDMVVQMVDLMTDRKGVGLAANQIGVEKRVIVMKTPQFSGVVINPVLSYGREKKWSREGCLSFPDEQVKIKRCKRVILTGYDLDWNEINVKLTGNSAFCAQHEVDHLNGITIIK